MNWKDQVTVITGAGSGIGAGLARHAALQGMKVVAVDVEPARLDKLEASIVSTVWPVLGRCVDVSDPDQVEKLAAEVFDVHGKVNILFNNAGILVNGKSWERSLDDWRRSIDVNVMGVIHGIRSFVPRMLKQGANGRVVNTSSVGGLLGGGSFMAPYQGTKHFVTALTESLYHELAMEEASITASVLCPGDVATRIFEPKETDAPFGEGSKESDKERAFNDFLAANVAKGMSADKCAELCFDAIEKGNFWLLPQPEFKPIYQLRCEFVVDETNPLSTEQMMSRFFSNHSGNNT